MGIKPNHARPQYDIHATTSPRPAPYIAKPHHSSLYHDSKCSSTALHLDSADVYPQDNSSVPIQNESVRPRYIAIGMILINGETGQDRYKCNAPTCCTKTFGRIAELKRHHACTHGMAGKKPQFWCPIADCERSRGGAGEAFPRKDKMVDHLSRVHADVVGRDE
ncbi:hypothetical protein GQ44DRAFT_47519 [Phaeosphaeriaceae sp. PMI808]|nr:hypothetical protein GQ44DRAFT_47519 [Phaeosphaeriaceae sp. PMI808]